MSQFKDFDTALKAYSATVSRNMEAARSCAIFAMNHFAEHGDTVLMQRFFDAMPKNYARRNAFLIWVHDHAPVTVAHEGKGVVKFIKDQTRADMEVDLEGAFKADFWDYSPEKAIVEFKVDNIVQAVQTALKKFHNTKKYQPESPEAAAELARIEKAISTIVKPEAAAA